MTREELREELRSWTWRQLVLGLLFETASLFPPLCVGYLLGLLSGFGLVQTLLQTH